MLIAYRSWPPRSFHCVGRRQVDGDKRGRNHVAGVLDGGAHPVAALAHRGVGQAHGMEGILFRNRAAVIHLNVNDVGVDAVDSRAEHLEKHD